MYLCIHCWLIALFCFSFRYDYLEFTDSNGNKKRFDQKVDTEKWPIVCTTYLHPLTLVSLPPVSHYVWPCLRMVNRSLFKFLFIVGIFLQSVNFKAGNRLLFNFHSDGSNNEWGYKFKVSTIIGNHFYVP